MLQTQFRSLVGSLLLGGCVVCAVGCGGSGEQKYAEQPIVEVKAVDNVRAWLQGVADSGELDSGADTIKDTIQQMKTEGANVDQLLKDADELIAMKAHNQIKAKAKAMLDSLPQ